MRKHSIDGVDVLVASEEKLRSYATAGRAIAEFEVPSLHDSVANPNSRLFVAMFDGTGNDVINDPIHATNVGLLKEQLENKARKDPTIQGYYKEGPGTQGGLKGSVDLVTGGTYQERIDAMFEMYESAAAKWLKEDPAAEIKVMSIGFSRGAEQAAGFCRLVHESSICNPALKSEVLRAPGTTAQVMALYDPVGTGEPSRNDRRPPPSVVSGLQIKAGDEFRSAFPSTTIIAQGKSEDGRFLGVTTAGAHSDIGGGYLLNGLPSRNFNLMADYLNRAVCDNLVTKVHVPAEPEKSVIHDSTQGQWFYRRVSERGVIDKAEPSGKIAVEPADPKIMQRFSAKHAHPHAFPGGGKEELAQDLREIKPERTVATLPASENLLEKYPEKEHRQGVTQTTKDSDIVRTSNSRDAVARAGLEAERERPLSRPEKKQYADDRGAAIESMRARGAAPDEVKEAAHRILRLGEAEKPNQKSGPARSILPAEPRVDSPTIGSPMSQRDIENSRKLVGDKLGRVLPARVDGQYAGKFLHMTETHLIQQTGKATVIAHDLSKLENRANLGKRHVEGALTNKTLKISYGNDKGNAEIVPSDPRRAMEIKGKAGAWADKSVTDSNIRGIFNNQVELVAKDIARPVLQAAKQKEAPVTQKTLPNQGKVR